VEGKLTSNAFAFILGNSQLEENLSLQVSEAIDKIESNFNSKQDFCFMKVRYIKDVSMSKSALKVETSIFIFAEDLADAVHEVMPRHGIAVVPWLAYAA